MKASLERLSEDLQSPFVWKEVVQSRFDAPYHFHPEFELTLIIAGEGKRFVGNQITDFRPGDLVLLGSNLPHCWQNHRSDWLGQEEDPHAAQAVVLHFNRDLLGAGFLDSAACQTVRHLLERAKGGLSIQGPTQDRVARDMLMLKEVAPFPRLIAFLQILHSLTLAGSDVQVIDSSEGNYALSPVDLERINRVYAYVIANYTREVHLDEVAHLANMTETAFCRYFKKVHNKTFVTFLNEFRIALACQLLIEKEHTVSEIGYQCGFNSISLFHRLFIRFIKLTPLEYRNSYKSI